MRKAYGGLKDESSQWGTETEVFLYIYNHISFTKSALPNAFMEVPYYSPSAHS